MSLPRYNEGFAEASGSLFSRVWYRFFGDLQKHVDDETRDDHGQYALLAGRTPGTDIALMIPRMTTAQRDALTASNGQVLYNTTTAALQCRVGGAWRDIVSVVTLPVFAASNVTTDRIYDADATTLDELADVVGTLIADLRAIGVVG